MTDLNGIFIYLFGFPGSGKYTIAKTIKEQVDNSVLLHNHAISDLIFPIVKADRNTKLPEEIWGHISSIRKEVLNVLSTLAYKDRLYLMTNCLFHEEDADQKIYQDVKKSVEKAGLIFFPVRLEISPEENKKRITSSERKHKFTLMHDEFVDEWHNNYTVLKTNHPNELTIDVSSLPKTEAASEVIKRITTKL